MRAPRAVAFCIALLAWLSYAAPAGAAATNDPGLPRQWNLDLIGAPAAWAVGTGAGVTIAVVDSGIDDQHEDLSGKVTLGANLVDGTTPARDDSGHGTHVAGIAAALTNNGRGVAGVAPDARLLSVKVINSLGRGGGSVDQGIRWAVDHGAKVVNISLGSEVQPVLGADFAGAIDYAWSRGVICVVAAGNEYVTGSGFSSEPALVVSAVNRNDTKPGYSSGVGSAQWGIAAPGGANDSTAENDVLSTWWDASHTAYAYAAGTSMAAPHVAGAAAILLSLGLTADQAVHRLLNTAKDIGAKGNDSTFGYGRLDLAAAVQGLGGPAKSKTASGGGAATTAGSSRSPSSSPGQRSSGSATTTGAANSASPAVTAGQPGGTDSAAGAANPSSAPSLAPDVARDAGTPPAARAGPARSHRPWGAAAIALALLVVVALAAVGLAGRPPGGHAPAPA
jgi:subtilisin family serine protease